MAEAHTLAIALRVEGEAAGDIRAIWRTLRDDLGVSRISHTSYAPHLTLAVGRHDDPASVFHRMTISFSGFESILVPALGLGCFFLPAPMFYIRWSCSAGLVQARNLARGVFDSAGAEPHRLHASPDWVAKTTLAAADTENIALDRIVPAIAPGRRWKPFAAETADLVVVEQDREIVHNSIAFIPAKSGV